MIGWLFDTKVSIRLFSDADKLCELKDSWNAFISKNSKNPLLLVDFITKSMEVNCSKGWTPLVLIVMLDNTIVGVIPLATKKKFGFRFVKSLIKPWFSPDFVTEDAYRKICVTLTLEFLFKTLHCHFFDFTLPAESDSLQVLMQKCEDSKIFFDTLPAMGHSIIPVGCTWAEFEKMRGRKFRRTFRRIERKLDLLGSRKMVYFENSEEKDAVFKRILDVEQTSWKEAWRTQQNIEADDDLLTIWAGAKCSAGTETGFKWSVWFLEIHDQTVAYSLVLQYKGEALIMKTSYNERYKKFYPGLYVNNVAVRELFNKGEVSNIDWLTALSFHRNWSSTRLSRVRVVMSQKGFSSIILRANSALSAARTILRSQRLEAFLNLIRR